MALGGLGLLAACLDLRSRLTRVTNPMHSVRFDIRRKFSKIWREENFPEKFLRSARPPDSVLRTPGRVIVNVTSARTRRKPSASTGSSPALAAVGRFGPAMSAAGSQKPRRFGAFAQALRSMQIACEFAGKTVKKTSGKSAPNVTLQALLCIYQSGRDNFFNVRIQERRTALNLLRPPSRSDCIRWSSLH